MPGVVKMEEINNGWKALKKEQEISEESVYFREKRVQLLENDELSYEEDGFMSGYTDIEEFEEMDQLLRNMEENFEGEI